MGYFAATEAKATVRPERSFPVSNLATTPHRGAAAAAGASSSTAGFLALGRANPAAIRHSSSAQPTGLAWRLKAPRDRSTQARCAVGANEEGRDLLLLRFARRRVRQPSHSARGVAGVQNTARSSAVQSASRFLDGVLRLLGIARSDRLAGLLHGGLHRAGHRLVASTALQRLAVTFF